MSSVPGVEGSHGEQPLVTVIVSTYNRLGLLANALQSVLNQDFRDFELLVSDDCGSVDVEGLIQEIDDPRIKYRRNPSNLGRGGNNRAAYRAAAGRYIAHLDDDDQWDPSFLSTLVPILEEHGEVALAFSDAYKISASGIVDLRATEHSARGWGRRDLAAGIHHPFFEGGLVTRSIVLGSAAVVRASELDLDDFPDEVEFAWDLWITYLALRNGMAVYYVPDRLASVRIHRDQSVQSLAALRTFHDVSFCFRRFLADDRLELDRSRLRAKVAIVEAYWSVALARSESRAEAINRAKESLRMRPTARGLFAFAVAALPRAAGKAVASSAAAVKTTTVGRRRQRLQST